MTILRDHPNLSIRVLLLGVLIGRLGVAQDDPATAKNNPLIESLHAENVNIRRDAAIKLRSSDSGLQRDALPAMIERLAKEKDGQVRLAVLDTLTALGRDAEPAVPALIQTLRSDYGAQKSEKTHQDYRSALALASIGKGSVAGLRELLSSRKENVRAEAVMALGRIGADASSVVPDLVLMLGDKSERVRHETALACGRMGRAAVDPLINACSRDDIPVRVAAVEGLGHLASLDEKASQAALVATNDSSPKVRAAAFESLAKMNLSSEILVPRLIENLRNDDESVRLSVVGLIVSRRELLERTAPELERLLAAKNDGVARNASYLLGRLGSAAVPRLISGLRSPESRIKDISGALAQTGRLSVEPLGVALDDPDSRVRRGAALALGQIRPLAPGTVPKLTATLQDKDPEVKAAVLSAIGDLGPRAVEALPNVRDLLHDGSATVRARAVDVLSRSAPRGTPLLDDFKSMLDDPDAQVQRRAIDAIRSLGPQGRGAMDAIISKLRSPEKEVRLAAADWVGSHGQDAATAVPALVAMLDDSSTEIQTVATKTLGKLGKSAQSAFDRLSVLATSGTTEVREAAVSTIGALGLEPEVVRPVIARCLLDDQVSVRLAAITSVQRLGPQGSLFIPDLILVSADKEKAASVQKLLRRYERRGPDARSVPELVKQLDHEQSAVRLLALKFLGLAGQHAAIAIPRLETLREDTNDEIRKQAVATIERIKNAPATVTNP